MGWGSNLIKSPWQKRPTTPPRTTPPPARNNTINVRNQLDYSSFSPSDPRSPLNFTTQLVNAGVPRSAINDNNRFVTEFGNYMRGGTGVQQTQPMFPRIPGAPGSGGGGGGGGGGGPAGLDQATFDWLMGQLSNKPALVNYRDLDLPDPSQYMKWDNALYNQARTGINTGLQQIQGRANTAYDQATAELQNYRNPFQAGPQQANPNYNDALLAMAAANNATGQLNQTVGEGAQADRAFGNVYALMAANDQARQAGNLRGIAGDRRTTEQNLGIEGNNLNLGVNMAEARGKTSFDQALQKAMFDTASQEAMGNYARRNEVESANAGTLNSWQQNILNQLLGLVSSKAPGTQLPGDMSWLNIVAPGINLMGGSGPVPAGV